MVMVDEGLRQKLIDLQKRDQKATGLTEEEFKSITREQTEQLKEIISKHGWPKISLVGDDGSEAAWLIVQHSDDDLEFQKECLELIIEANKNNEAPKRHIAYLQDRILVNEDKPQKFGTQIKNDGGDNVEPLPIAEDNNLDQLRAEYGLPPLEMYIQIIKNFNKNKQ